MRYSIIVPTLNPGELWLEWIAAIKIQSIPPSMVYVIDSGSTDDSVAQSVNAGFSVTNINQDEYNHGGTRQKALNLINSDEYVVLMTQDALLSASDSIKNILRPFENKDVAAVCGRQLPNHGAGAVEAHARLFNYPDKSFTRTYKDRESFGLKTAFLSNSFAAYRISALKEVGGFPNDVIFGEDMYVAAKLLKSGWNIAYAADACVYHSHGYTMLQEFKRYFDMGVFHAREPWIRKGFGGAERQGFKFIASEMQYLLHHAFWEIPLALFRTIFRLAGFKFGLIERWIPFYLKKYMCMNSVYFKKTKL